MGRQEAGLVAAAAEGAGALLPPAQQQSNGQPHTARTGCHVAAQCSRPRRP